MVIALFLSGWAEDVFLSQFLCAFSLMSHCREGMKVLKFRCPKCGKGEKSELLEVFPERKYGMKCGDCRYVYILTASGDIENKAKKSRKKKLS